EDVARDVVEAQRLRAPHLVRARELLQPAHDLRAVLGGLLDDGERAADALVLEAAQHQLHAPDDDRQEIIEVVRGAARQLAQRVPSVVGEVVDEERLTGGRHAPGVAGPERQREIGGYGGARQRADTQGARLRVHDQQLDVWRAGDAGRLVHDLLEGRQRIE